MSGRPPPDIAKLHVTPAQDDADLLAHVNDGFDAFNRFQDQLRAALAPMRFNPLFAASQFQIIQVPATTLGNPPTFALQYRSSGTAAWSTIVSFSSTGVPTIDTLTGYLKGAAGVVSAQAVPIPIADGGTNSTTALSGSSIMKSDGSKIVQGPAGTTTTLLHGNASGAPTYAAVSMTADVTGTLPEGNGGTNQVTYAQGDILYASASNTLSKLAKGTSGQLLQQASNIPAWAGETSWTAPTLLNSWVDFGGGQVATGYLKDAAGFVHLRGLPKSGTATANTVLFNLPAGYRPSAALDFVTASNGAFGELDITTGGDVRIQVGSNVYFSLNGITFDTR